MVCTSDYYYKNKIFNLNDPANRDNYYYPFYLLRNKFYKSNVLLNTYDYLDKNKDNAYGLVFFDIPNNIDEYIHAHRTSEKYLVIWESAIIRPINWRVTSHEYFKKIFTWNDDFVDNKKYFKVNFSSKIPADLNFNIDKKNKFCTMIVGHKFKTHPLELYSERVKAIRWFEQNHPEVFDLYGIGWDRYCFKDNLSKLNKLKFLTKLLKPRFTSYEGVIEAKKPVLQQYKFAICYENARDIPGYITEKIFDCFFAGCIPVYLGAPNVTEHIPEDTFIDKRNFKTYDELYRYLKNMPEREYINYLDGIKNFIQSDEIYPFSAEYFIHTITSEILDSLNI